MDCDNNLDSGLPRSAASHTGAKMNRRFHFIALAVAGIVVMTGCNSPDTSRPATDQEKKVFGGGPMPPEARKQFEDAQKKSAQQTAQQIAERVAKARAAAASGK